MKYFRLLTLFNISKRNAFGELKVLSLKISFFLIKNFFDYPVPLFYFLIKHTKHFL